MEEQRFNLWKKLWDSLEEQAGFYIGEGQGWEPVVGQHETRDHLLQLIGAGT